MGQAFRMKLTRLRKQRGLTLLALAKRIGTSEAYVHMLESGVRTNPSLRTLEKLAKALKVKVSQLVERRPEMSELDDHALGIGQIIGNLQSLEVAIRLFLEWVEPGPASPRWSDPFSLKQGGRLPKTALTDYASLGQLIDRYNRHIAAINLELTVDRSVVEVRDALVHGRLLAQESRRPLRLFRFSEPCGGTVEVRQVTDVTDKWLADQRRHIADELEKVHCALEILGNT